MPAITLSSFFPDWEHSGCIPLDGYRESNFAGSRNMQLLVSRENLCRIFVFSSSLSAYVIQLSLSSQKVMFSGVENCLIGDCSKSSVMIHLILVSFSDIVSAKTGGLS